MSDKLHESLTVRCNWLFVGALGLVVTLAA